MSRRLKTFATLNVLGWLVAVPLLGAALLGPIVGYTDWEDRLLPGGGDTVALADLPARPAPARTPAPDRGTGGDTAAAPVAALPVIATATPREPARSVRASVATSRRPAARRRAVARRRAAAREARRTLAAVRSAAAQAPVSVKSHPVKALKAPHPSKAPKPVKAPRPAKPVMAPRPAPVRVHKVKLPKLKAPKLKLHKPHPLGGPGKGPKPR